MYKKEQKIFKSVRHIHQKEPSEWFPKDSSLLFRAVLLKKREAIWQTYQIMRHWHISVVLSRHQYIIQLPVNFPVMCFKQKKKFWTKWPEVCGHLTITSTCLLDIPFHQHGHYHGAAKSLGICAPSSKLTLMRSGIGVAINVPDLPQCVQWSLRTSLCAQSWCEGSFQTSKCTIV